MSTPRCLNILITGGARGIGRGLTRHFLRAGHSVLILDANESELSHTRAKGQEWRQSNPNTSSTWHALNCDLRDRAAIKSAVEEAKSIFNGHLDVLINNAIPDFSTYSEDASEDAIMEDWDQRLAVGLTAPFMLSRLYTPLLRANPDDPDSKPGCIINISSTRADQAEMDHESYSAVKAGILGLTQSMAVSFGHRYKIRVNAIVPGWIHVGNERAEADEKGMGWEEGLTKEDAEWHPAGRVGKVEDVARAAQYLVQSEFVTGSEVVVDGGVTRKMVYPD